jgi:hypothetical protein
MQADRLSSETTDPDRPQLTMILANDLPIREFVPELASSLADIASGNRKNEELRKIKLI